MATLKHIASKNSDYTAIEAYLIYQHDAFTGKQLLDDHGRPMLRESYLLDTLECGDFSFATACLLANRKYSKNNHPDDIKSHQYIISFDPRDAADNGLTMEKAQALGLKFCSENFPGHPAIVCTHPDGHNHSGNIHVHIVIGSIRMREVERKPYMQKPRDWREGMKHSSTAQTMRHLRVEVMELCEGAGLYQIDLLNGSKERVSEAEYWARRRGQQKLDLANAALTATEQPPKQKKFETVKDILRKQILDVLDNATSFEDFSEKLIQQYGIAAKESRGCLSYLPAGRTKFIRAKHLGDKFDKAAILQKHPEIYFSTMPLPFESREEVLSWICKNQLGRRNLTPEQKKFLMGKQYSSEKRTEAFRGNQHTAKKSGSVQSEHNQKPMKTCERIAQENHSSASSVRRAEYYAHGVDVADELSPGFRDRFFREELHIPDYLLENLGKAKPEEQAEIFEEIKNYVPKPKKVKPNKVTVKQAEKAASNTIDENYDVPQKFLELYYRLHNAESLMRKSWEVTFDLNPKLLTHPEQVKVLRFALKPHLEFLKTLDEVLAESSSESSKTA